RVSRHIRILGDAALVARRKEGAWVFVYNALPGAGTDSDDAGIADAVSILLAAAEGEDATFATQCAADRRRLAAIRSAREEAAARYFSDHADQWDQLRSLHSDDGEVETALNQALGGKPCGHLLDIGTGTGRIAELLSDRASHVTGLDRSPDMLRLARTRLQNLPADKFDLVHGDFTALPFDDASFDTVTLHQVLHFALTPDDVLAEAARVTRDGGRIVVTDFTPHDREELRRLHAHTRLGFGADELAETLTRNGFAPDPVQFVPGSELTIAIWAGTRLAT
ncbi:MAG: methyltransferase domain-containing protein, partial [Novosphingobium sp.]